MRLYCFRYLMQILQKKIKIFSFFLKLHMVHFNTKYRTITDAIDKEDGIAVVAILFQVSFDIAYLIQ